MILKIPKQIFLHDTLTHDDASCFDLDLEYSNLGLFVFSQETLAYDEVPPDQVELPKNKQFRR